MQSRRIALQLLLGFLVLGCAACTVRDSGTQPNPAMQANSDLPAARTLNLRGQLRAHEGEQPTGVLGVLFAIYDQQEGGTPLWQETQNVEVNKRGRFKAQVGSTKREGIPPELFQTEKPLWLGTLVLLPGEVEQPRVRLVDTRDGLVAELIIPEVTPETSGDQPSTAEAQEASAGPSGSPQPDSQQSKSEPTNGRFRARRGFRRQTP